MKDYPRSGNLAVRRELALAAGGFPAASHGEDLEFSHKVMQLVGRAEFAESAQDVHNERRGVRAAAREAFKKGEARGWQRRRGRSLGFRALQSLR